VHVAPTGDLVGLGPVADTADVATIVDGVELDYTSNELGAVLVGAIKGNGNYLERVLGELALSADAALLAGARAVTAPLVSRRVGRHYAGFAASQLRAFDGKPTAKRALYVLRTAATGRHLLASGEVITDVARLGAYLPDGADQLMQIKLRGEREPLAADVATAWRARLVAAIAAVDAAWPSSVLPAEPTAAAIAAADAWLREVRRAAW
jgi:predicted nucleotidyltransferase